MLATVLIASIVFVLVDSFYLRSVSSHFNRQLLAVQKSPLVLELAPTFLSYLFLIIGLYYFILRENRSVFDAFMLGLVIYMVYEATNKAIIKDWMWKTVLLDGLWGGVLYALTTYITYKIRDYLV